MYLAGDAARARASRELEEAFRRAGAGDGRADGAAGGRRAWSSCARTRARCSTSLISGAALAAVLVSGAAGLATIVLAARAPLRARALLRRARRGRGRGRVGARPAARAAARASRSTRRRPATPPSSRCSSRSRSGSLILLPSLALLFGLVLRGRFDEEQPSVHGAEPAPVPGGRAAPGPARCAGLLVVGLPLALLGEGVVLGIGFAALAGFVAVGAIALLDPARLSGQEGQGPA